MALRLCPAILLFISFMALVLGTIFHSIYIDESLYNKQNDDFDKNVIIDDKLNNLMWFMQITDLHINIKAPDRERDFEDFATSYIDIIKPSAILVTGDITDGRIPDTILGTAPQLHDWSTYSDIITKTGAANKTLWLDIRGNHDNFNVYKPRDAENLFRKYSIQGKVNPRNQFNILEKDGKNYSFIGVDEIQPIGAKLPFNFLGIVDHDDILELESFKKKSAQAMSQSTVWYAHYPTSSVESRIGNLKDIINGPYLCGHFHNIGGLVNEMYANQQNGYTEAELGDWKYNRYLRLAAIDHQLFSMVDFKFKQWPIALITNPKNAENRMPKYEPLERIATSSHIRVIAFSNVTVTKVEISINGQSYVPMKESSWPLYVLEWKVSQYSKQVHLASVRVTDASGSSLTYNQSFSLETPVSPDASFKAKLFLRARFRNFMMSVFLFLVAVCVLPLIVLRFAYCDNLKHTFLYKIQILSRVNKLYYTLVLLPIYVALGPQFIGRLVDEAMGICFVWGIFIDNQYLYTGITFNASSVFLLIVHIPTLLLLSLEISDRYHALLKPDEYPHALQYRLLIQLCITLVQLLMGVLLYSAYGFIAFLTSFLYFWSVFIYGYCWLTIRGLTRADFFALNLQRNVDSPQQEQLLARKQNKTDSSSIESAGLSSET